MYQTAFLAIIKLLKGFGSDCSGPFWALLTAVRPSFLPPDPFRTLSWRSSYGTMGPDGAGGGAGGKILYLASDPEPGTPAEQSEGWASGEEERTPPGYGASTQQQELVALIIHF